MTAEWIQRVLGLPEIEGVTVARVGAAFGLASRLARVTVSEPPLSAVAKMWSTESEAGNREVRFYRQLAPSVGIRVPRCLVAAVDEETGRAVLLLEDIAPARQGDVLEEISPTDLAAIAATYAELHRSPPPLPEWLPPLRWTGLTSDWFAARSAAFTARYGRPPGTTAAVLFDRAEHAHEAALARLAGQPETLLHKDAHLDNVLFSADGPVLLDWAGCARGAGVLDLAPVVFGMGRPGQYDRAIAAYTTASGTDVDRAALGGAFLVWFIVHTLGIAGWEPKSDRERRMAAATIARVADAAEAWREVDPELFAEVL